MYPVTYNMTYDWNLHKRAFDAGETMVISQSNYPTIKNTHFTCDGGNGTPFHSEYVVAYFRVKKKNIEPLN